MSGTEQKREEETPIEEGPALDLAYTRLAFATFLRNDWLREHYPFPVLLADGTIRFLSPNIDQKPLGYLLTTTSSVHEVVIGAPVQRTFRPITSAIRIGPRRGRRGHTKMDIPE